MNTQLKRIVMSYLLLVCAVSAGCIATEIDKGFDEMGRRNYDDAVHLFEKGLRIEADRGWYNPKRWFKKSDKERKAKISLPIARFKAGDVHTDEGARHYIDGRMVPAEKELKEALEFDPKNYLAKLIINEIECSKKQTRESIEKAKDLMDKRQWDKALDVLQRVFHLSPTYREIAEHHARCVKASYDEHFEKGKKLFESSDYAVSVQELKKALTRAPDSRQCMQWYENSLEYRRASEHCDRAAKKHTDGEYEEAYNIYGTALECVPSFKPALSGQKTARDAWVNEMMVTAHELFQSGSKGKTYKSHELLLKCYELQPEHKELTAFWPEVKHRLAETFAVEAKSLTGSPKGAAVATAWYAINEAERFDRSVPGVSELKAKLDTLMRAKTGAFVTLVCEDESPFAEQIRKEVVRRVQWHNIPCLHISDDQEDLLLKGMKSKVAQMRLYDDFPFVHGDLKVKINKDTAFKHKVEKDEARSSRAFIGEESVKNTLWANTSTGFQTNLKSLAGLQGEHSTSRSKYEAAKVAKNRADTLYEAANCEYGLLSQLRNEHNQRSSQWQGRNLINGANCEAQNYDMLDGVYKGAQSARERTSENRDTAHAELNSSTSHLHSVISSIKQMEGMLCKQRCLLDFQTPQILEPRYAAYDVTVQKWACEGGVDITSFVELSSGDCYDPGAVCENLFKAEIRKGAKALDTTGIVNAPDPLPEQETFLADIEQRAISGFIADIVESFWGDHEKYFDIAKEAEEEEDAAVALENYILYMYMDGMQNQRRYRQAEKYTKEQMKNTLPGI